MIFKVRETEKRFVIGLHQMITIIVEKYVTLIFVIIISAEIFNFYINLFKVKMIENNIEKI